MSEQRTHIRQTVSWRVAIIPAGSPKPLQGRAFDVSEGGAGVLLPLNLQAKTRCTLIFEIPSADYRKRRYIETIAVVMHATLVGHISEYRTGMKFLEPCLELMQVLGKNHPVRQRKPEESDQITEEPATEVSQDTSPAEESDQSTTT